MGKTGKWHKLTTGWFIYDLLPQKQVVVTHKYIHKCLQMSYIARYNLY